MDKIFYLLVFLFTSTVIRSQELKKYLRPESPEAASFVRFDDMPLCEYLGKSDINIPIYTIQEDNFELPVQLSYNTGGIKVGQQASWIGLGWDLNIGSLIQIINDEDDYCTTLNYGVKIERMLPNYPGSQGGYGCVSWFPPRYQYPFSYDGPGWTPTYPTNIQPTADYIFKIATDYYIPYNGDFRIQRRDFFVDEGTNNYDSEPDIFKANFLGTSLSFIIDWKTNTYNILNKKGYRVFKDGNQWVITNPSGEKFYFGNKSETITEMIYASQIGGIKNKRKSMISWFLNKIETKNGKLITIEYEQTSSIRMPENKTSIEKYKNITTSHTLQGTEYAFIQGKDPSNEGISSNINISEEPYSFIKKIIFPKGEIDFTLSNRADILPSKRLSRIEVKNTSAKIIKTIELTHDYFVQTDNGKRLKLVSVKEGDDWIYSFAYHTGNKLPALNSFSQDCWGYYNGHANKNLIPNAARYYLPAWNRKVNNGNNMSANLEYTKVGTLYRITYPTGGMVNLIYELHTFDNYKNLIPKYSETSINTNTGMSEGYGLRIKEIQYEDKDYSLIKKVQYTYEGGKALLPKLLFRAINYKECEQLSTSSFVIRSGKIEESTISGYTIFNPLSSFDGVGYDKVIKKVIGNDVGPNERIETCYSNNPDITGLLCSESDALIPIPAYKNINKSANGSILSTSYFDIHNKLISSIKYSYENVISPIYYGTRPSGYDYIVCPFNSGFYYKPRNIIGYYPIFDLESLVISKETTDYLEPHPVVARETYDYDSVHRLTDKKQELSDGIWGRYFYTWYSYPTTANTAEQRMITKNRIADIISLKTQWSGPGFGYSYLKNNYVWDSSKLKLRLSSIEKKRSQSDVGFIDKVSYEVFDQNDNPSQIRSLDNTPITYIWGYQGQYLIAEVRNATYSDVSNKLGTSILSRLESSVEPSIADLISLNGLRESMPETLITTYTHIPLVGIESIIDERGVRMSFQYDASGRLISKKDSKNNIIERMIYHTGINTETLQIELSEIKTGKPVIKSIQKEGSDTYVYFTIPGVNDDHNSLTVYTSLYDYATKKVIDNYAGYSKGKRSLGKLIVGNKYRVVIGVYNGLESDSMIIIAK